MTVRKKLDDLKKPLGEVTPAELAKCIVHGLKDRGVLEAHSEGRRIRDGGPIMALRGTLTAWKESILEEERSAHDRPGGEE